MYLQKHTEEERLSHIEKWVLKVARGLGEEQYEQLANQLGVDDDDVDLINRQFTENHEKALVVMQVGLCVCWHVFTWVLVCVCVHMIPCAP